MNPNIAKDLLRLHDEPCQYYNELQIHNELMRSGTKLMDYLEQVYESWSKNDKMVHQPDKQVFEIEGIRGDFRVMPCIFQPAENLPVKVVKVIGTNEEETVVKDKISVGKALLLNPKDNFVEAIMDVAALSSFRTASISTLAFKRLMGFKPEQKNIIGIVGAGRVGFYTAFILNQWLGVKNVMVTDINQNNIERFLSAKKHWASLLNVQVCSLKDISLSCDSIFLCTTSFSPILSAATVNGAKYISSVGADADNLSELDSCLIPGRQIIVDTMQGFHFGDLKRWKAKNLVNKKNVVEFRKIFNSSKLPLKNVLFISTGAAIQDAITCHFIHERLKSKK